MGCKKPAHPPVMRTDLLPSNLTAAKERAVREMLHAYRRGAVLLGREQWRLNAILWNCGRSIVEAKLADLIDRHGIPSTVVNPAYTSQTCSACGYVDKRNRRDQKAFRCLWCGHEVHADLNAAANIEARRSCPNGWLFQGRAALQSRGPAELVRAFGERRVRATGADHGPTPIREPGCPRRPTTDISLLRWGEAGRGEVNWKPKSLQIAGNSSPSGCLS